MIAGMGRVGGRPRADGRDGGAGENSLPEAFVDATAEVTRAASAFTADSRPKSSIRLAQVREAYPADSMLAENSVARSSRRGSGTQPVKLSAPCVRSGPNRAA